MKAIYLKTKRERLGMTQGELSAESRVAQNTISKLESNPKSDPGFSTVVALASALKVNPLVLRFGPDPRASQRATPPRKRRSDATARRRATKRAGRRGKAIAA